MTSSRNVVVGKPKPNGAIFRAPLGTTLPTTESTTLPAAAIEQGYASSDGLSRAIAKAYEQIRAWGGDEVARPRTEHSVTMTFTLIEAANGEVAKTIWGEDAVTITPATSSTGTAIAVAYAGDDLPESVWIFDMQDRGHLRRIVVPRAANVTEDFTQTFVDNNTISYPVTLVLFADEAGKFFYEYSNDGVKAAG